MIDPALLDRLQKADPKTWDMIIRGLPLKPIGQYITYDHGERRSHQYKETYIPIGELLPEVAETWLQAVLQDAIQARGWGLHQVFFLKGGCWKRPYAMISEGVRAPLYAEGDSPAEALLRAYLAAIEVNQL